MTTKTRKKKRISISPGQTRDQDRERTFGLDITADSGLLEGLLLLLNGRALFNGLTVSASASEEHGGETMSDGRADGDRTRSGGHLGQHARTVARLRRGRLVRDGR
jgi:hypothetical protein